MSKVDIVSAFFDINRDSWSVVNRSLDQYIEYFKYWAKMDNNMIIYVNSKYVEEKVIEIRKQMHFENQTTVIFVEEWTDLDRELYLSIKKATENPIQILSRILPKNPESWNTNYNYAMMLKFWCVKDAIQRNLVRDNIAWVDFGFGHGSNTFDNPECFNFSWNAEFENKIYLFNIQPLDDRPLFDIIKSMDTYFMGPIIFGREDAWRIFCDLIFECMKTLNSVGLVDDDQAILLMAYRLHPELFIVSQSTWFKPIVDYANKNIRLKEEDTHSNFYKFLRNIKHSVVHRKHILKMLVAEYRHYKNIVIH